MRALVIFIRTLLIVLASVALPAFISGQMANKNSTHRDNPHIPDISGLAWVEGRSFLAVHDAKHPDEDHLPRASLVRLPASLGGIERRTLELLWQIPKTSISDLESIARIPDTMLFLLVESGENVAGAPPSDRIFLTELADDVLTIRSAIRFPHAVENIEGSAVASIDGRLVFIWAERAHGSPRTELSWAELNVEPLGLGPRKHVYFRPGSFTGADRRPVSAIDVDHTGRIFIASAFDPKDDNGPFSSVVWEAGRIVATSRGGAAIRLYTEPRQLAQLDGLKVEGVAVRRTSGGIEIYVGMDDENYGGAVRQISYIR